MISLSNQQFTIDELKDALRRNKKYFEKASSCQEKDFISFQDLLSDYLTFVKKNKVTKEILKGFESNKPISEINESNWNARKLFETNEEKLLHRLFCLKYLSNQASTIIAKHHFKTKTKFSGSVKKEMLNTCLQPIYDEVDLKIQELIDSFHYSSNASQSTIINGGNNQILNGGVFSNTKIDYVVSNNTLADKLKQNTELNKIYLDDSEMSITKKMEFKDAISLGAEIKWETVSEFDTEIPENTTYKKYSSAIKSAFEREDFPAVLHNCSNFLEEILKLIYLSDFGTEYYKHNKVDDNTFKKLLVQKNPKNNEAYDYGLPKKILDYLHEIYIDRNRISGAGHGKLKIPDFSKEDAIISFTITKAVYEIAVKNKNIQNIDTRNL